MTRNPSYVPSPKDNPLQYIEVRTPEGIKVVSFLKDEPRIKTISDEGIITLQNGQTIDVNPLPVTTLYGKN
jgi:hypothetical protein